MGDDPQAHEEAAAMEEAKKIKEENPKMSGKDAIAQAHEEKEQK